MQDYVTRWSEPVKQSSPTTKNSYLKWVIIIFFLVVFLGFLRRHNSLQNFQVVSPLSDDIITFISQKMSKPKNTTSLLEQIKAMINKTSGNWGVYVYDLNFNQGFGLNENGIYIAASINKIPILASLYYYAAKGEIDLDRIITLQDSDIQDYGTGSIRYDPPGTAYSIRTLARLMMQKSDNTAAFLLGRQVLDLNKVQNLLDSWGLTQTDMENNKTSLLDITKLLVKMYQNEVTNKAETTEMLGFMTDSDFENRLPKLLPKEVKIYHKIGTEVNNAHDVGIIDLKNHPYIIGVLTADITNPEEAEKTISQISKLVFDFMK